MALLRFLYRSFQGFPAPIWYLTGVAFIAFLGDMAVPFMALYLNVQLEFPIGAVGNVFLAFGIGSVLGAYGGGILTNHLRSEQILIFCLIAQSCVLAFFYFASRPFEYAGGMLVLGFLTALFRPAYNRIILLHCPPNDRSRAYALFRVAINLAAAAAAGAAGLLSTVDMRLLFVVNGTATTGAGLFLLGVLLFAAQKPTSVVRGNEEERDVDAGAKRGPGRWAAYGDIGFLALCIASFLVDLVVTQQRAAYPAYLHEYYGLSVGTYAALYAVSGLLIVFLEVPIIHAVKGSGNRIVALVGALMICGGYAILPFGTGLALAVLSLVVFTLGEILLYPSFMGLVLNRAAVSRNQGQYLGLYHSIFPIAILIGPAAGTHVYKDFGGDAVWFLAGALGLVAAGLIGAAPRLRTSPTREISNAA